MLRPTQRGEGEMVSWKHTQPCKYSDMFAHTSQTATFFCARLFVYVCVSVCVCDIVWSSFTQICLSVSLSLQLSNVAGGGRGDALVLELASHQISLHLLHFLFILYPPPPSCAPLSLSPSLPVIYHYPLVIITVLEAADGHDNSCPILPAEFKRWFPLKKKLKTVVGYATMCNHSYEHERYTVGTPWCDVDSSGSWRGGRAGCSFSQSEGRNKEGTGEGGRASERENRHSGGREGGRERG